MTGNRDLGQGRWAGLPARIAGAGLLGATGAIHLDLYLTGYRSIPTIGWLFLLQVIAAFALAAAVAVTGHPLLAAAGAGFALSTLAGYLLSVWVGLFGFREVRTTAGIAAGIIEVAAFAALAVACLTASRRRLASGRESSAGREAGPGAKLTGLLSAAPRVTTAAAAGLAIAALALVGVAAATTGARPVPSIGRDTVQVATIGGTRVLTNSQGRTLYWFAPDSTTASKCYGSCAAYWPPVPGPVSVTGIGGRFGTIQRTDASVQATYNGHPLYTYIADTAAGQARGNNINLNGGVWHEVVVSG